MHLGPHLQDPVPWAEKEVICTSHTCLYFLVFLYFLSFSLLLDPIPDLSLMDLKEHRQAHLSKPSLDMTWRVYKQFPFTTKQSNSDDGPDSEGYVPSS